MDPLFIPIYVASTNHKTIMVNIKDTEYKITSPTDYSELLALRIVHDHNIILYVSYAASL